jgi:hypothetical protein
VCLVGSDFCSTLFEKKKKTCVYPLHPDAQPVGFLSRAQLPGAPRARWNKRKYGASKLRFPHAKDLLLKLSGICACALKTIHRPSLKLKKVIKNTGFNGRLYVPGCPLPAHTFPCAWLLERAVKLSILVLEIFFCPAWVRAVN